MTRFVTYDPEVAARLSQAVGVHRVELRDTPRLHRALNPALLDLVRSPRRSAVLTPAQDEQVLVISVDDGEERTTKPKKNAKRKPEVREIGSQPSGFLGLNDEPVFSEDEEDPPRSLWKIDE